MMHWRFHLKDLFLLSISTLFIFSGSVLAGNRNDLIESLANGTINWSKGIITATGSSAAPPSLKNPAQARLMAKRAAIVDARRNLLETVKGVRVDAQTTVQSHMTVSDVVVSKVNGMVKLSVVVSTRYMNNGAVEVTVAMPLTGDLLKLMLEQLGKLAGSYTPSPLSREIPQRKPLTRPPPPRPSPSPPVPEPSSPSLTLKPTVEAKAAIDKKEAKKEIVKDEFPTDLDLSKLNYSGLVVDARRLQLRPALVPKILDQRGEIVYSAANLIQKDSVKMGVVGYAKDVDAAKKNQRVTATPFVIKGVHATGQKKTDVVINNRDAKVVQGSDRHTNYLKNGRVLVVYD